MGIANFCAAHWATMAHEEEAPYPAEDATCDFCGKPAARAAGHEMVQAIRGHLDDRERTGWVPPVDPEPRSLLSDVPAVRLAQLEDLHAPMGEDGARHPEAGLISSEQFRELLDEPTG